MSSLSEYVRRMIDLIDETPELSPTDYKERYNYYRLYIVDKRRFDKMSSLMMLWDLPFEGDKREIIKMLISSYFLCYFDRISFPTVYPEPDQLKALTSFYYKSLYEANFEEEEEDELVSPQTFIRCAHIIAKVQDVAKIMNEELEAARARLRYKTIYNKLKRKVAKYGHILNVEADSDEALSVLLKYNGDFQELKKQLRDLMDKDDELEGIEKHVISSLLM